MAPDSFFVQLLNNWEFRQITENLWKDDLDPSDDKCAISLITKFIGTFGSDVYFFICVILDKGNKI